MGDDKHGSTGEPLPIWFFVGVILLTYGLLLIAADFTTAARTTVLAETRPCLWWGAVTAVCGGVFLGIGLRVRSLEAKARREEAK